jgi:hypothetical protein
MITVIIQEMQRPHFNINSVYTAVSHALKRPDINRNMVNSYIGRVMDDINKGRPRFFEFEYIAADHCIKHKDIWYLESTRKRARRMKPYVYRFQSAAFEQQPQT